MNFLSKQNPIVQKLNEDLQAAKSAGQDEKSIQAEIEKVNKEVDDFQIKLMEKHSGSLTARIVKTSRDIEIPEFDMSSSEGQIERFRFLQKHWFDNANMSDPCLIRTTLLHGKVNTYLEKLTPQHPDSIIRSIDYILSLIHI